MWVNMPMIGICYQRGARADVPDPGRRGPGAAARLRHPPGRRAALRGPGPAPGRDVVRGARPARRRRVAAPRPRGGRRRPPASLLPDHRRWPGRAAFRGRAPRGQRGRRPPSARPAPGTEACVTLEDKYRRLSRLFPAEWRERYEEELIGTLLDGAETGRGSIPLPEAVDLVRGAIVLRLRAW